MTDPDNTPAKVYGRRLARLPRVVRCPACAKVVAGLKTIQYSVEVRHGDRIHMVYLPSLKIPVCSCGERVFTEQVDDQINDALHRQLGILS